MVQYDQLDLQWRLIDGQFNEVGARHTLDIGNFGQQRGVDIKLSADRALDGVALAEVNSSRCYPLVIPPKSVDRSLQPSSVA